MYRLIPRSHLRFARLIPSSRKVSHLVKLLILFIAGLQAVSVYAATQPTAATLSASSNSLNQGTPVKLTAAITANGSPVIHGEVEFCYSPATSCEDLALIGKAELTSNGTASIKLLLPPGTHDIYAYFLGTTSYSSSSSLPSVVTVDVKPMRASSTADISKSGSTGRYTLSSKVSGLGRQPVTGFVGFLDAINKNRIIGAANLGPSTLSYGLAEPSTLWSTTSIVAVTAVTQGDFNGDGLTDLAFALSTGTIQFLLNDSKHPGQFVQSSKSITVPNAQPVSCMTAGDFNADGVQDLAICMDQVDKYSSTGQDLGILYPGAVGILQGDTANPGQFLPISSYTTGDYYSSIQSADINRDGFPDLVFPDADLTNSHWTVDVMLGDPSNPGHFQATTKFPVSSQFFSGKLGNVAVADLNGDGFPDVALDAPGNMTFTGAITEGNVEIFLGDPTHPGTLTSSGTYSNSTYFPASLSIADFNRDGVPDIATTSGPNLEVLLGDPVNRGKFLPSSTYPATGNLSGVVGGHISSLLVGDFNDDGTLDLVVSQTNPSFTFSNDAGIFWGDPAHPGQFQLPEQVYSKALDQTLVFQPSLNLVADFNGDGLPDVIEGESTVRLLADAATSTAMATATNIVPPSGTNYVYALYSGNQDYYGSQSCAISLTGTVSAPAISNVTVSSVTSTSATISWTTNVDTYGGVAYGPTSSFGSQTAWVSQVSTNHSFVLNNLTPGTTFYYQVWAVSFFNGCTHWSTSSNTATFTTTAQ